MVTILRATCKEFNRKVKPLRQPVRVPESVHQFLPSPMLRDMFSKTWHMTDKYKDMDDDMDKDETDMRSARWMAMIAMNASLDDLKWCVDQVPAGPIRDCFMCVLSNVQKVFRSLQHGGERDDHVRNVKSILTEYVSTEHVPKLTETIECICNNAAAGGHVDLMRLCMEKMERVHASLLVQCGRLAAKYGNQNVVQYLLSTHLPKVPRVIIGVMCGAIEGKKQSLINWVFKTKLFSIVPREDKEDVINIAARHGRLDVLKHLDEKKLYDFSVTPSADMGENGEAVIEAIRNRRVKVLRWLVEEKERPIFDAYMGQDICMTASETGNIQLVKLARSLDRRRECWSEQVCNAAASGGHLSLLQWLVEQRCPADMNSLLEVAASHGHIHIVRWLVNNTAHQRIRIGIAESNPIRFYKYAAARGHVHIIEWGVQNKFKTNVLETKFNEMFARAMYGAHRNVIEWMLQHPKARVHVTYTAQTWTSLTDGIFSDFIKVYSLEDRIRRIRMVRWLETSDDTAIFRDAPGFGDRVGGFPPL